MGIGESTLRIRIGNFKALAGEGGLGNWAKQSERVFVRYENTDEATLRRDVFEYLHALMRSKGSKQWT